MEDDGRGTKLEARSEQLCRWGYREGFLPRNIRGPQEATALNAWCWSSLSPHGEPAPRHS